MAKLTFQQVSKSGKLFLATSKQGNFELIFTIDVFNEGVFSVYFTVSDSSGHCYPVKRPDLEDLEFTTLEAAIAYCQSVVDSDLVSVIVSATASKAVA